jgi:hypothetical protein
MFSTPGAVINTARTADGLPPGVEGAWAFGELLTLPG